MASLTTPLSVRLSDEDTNFLANLEMDGAVTSSEKIRGLIRIARQRAEEPTSFPAALALSHDYLAHSVRSVRILEQDADKHSDVTMGLMTTAEEFLALALTVPKAAGGDGAGDALRQHEARLVDCAARMTEQLLRWALTPTAPAYDPAVVTHRLSGLEDLMRLIVAGRPAR
jgi:hypothetical protein